MTQLVFNKRIANEIFNDNSFREELITALNELIDIELSRSDDEIDFDLIDAYTDALNELYDEKGIVRVFWKLQTVEEFTKAVTGNKKWKKISLGMKITLTACALIALMISANTVTEKITGYDVLEQVANAVQQLFTGETVTNNSTTTTEPQTEDIAETTTQSVAAESSTEVTTAEPFTRVDEEATAAPIVIKLSGEMSENFKRDYIVGEDADFSGLTITAQYDNGEIKQISIDECNVYGFSTETPANRIVTVEYEDCSFSFLIRVKEAN